MPLPADAELMSSHAGPVEPSVAAQTSPELVLVDQELAVLARELLDEPDDTLARLERRIRLNRLAFFDGTIYDDTTRDRAGGGHFAPVSPARVSRRGTRTKLLAGTTTAAALIAALLLGVTVNLGGTPAGADSHESESLTTIRPPERAKAPAVSAPVEKKASRSSSSRPATPATQGVGPRRFAWAPVPDASGYHIEFFRATVRVYSGDTKDPQIELAQKWTFGGRKYRLAPGEYRWYVWPVVSGLRQTQATVQAELVIR
jgi:hypothetical protein